MVSHLTDDAWRAITGMHYRSDPSRWTELEVERWFNTLREIYKALPEPKTWEDFRKALLDHKELRVNVRHDAPEHFVQFVEDVVATSKIGVVAELVKALDEHRYMWPTYERLMNPSRYA